MPTYRRPDRARAENPGQCGAGASGCRRRRQLRRQARHQAHGAVRLSGAAARLPGAADRGPAGKYARRRRAWAGPAFSTSRSPSTMTASCSSMKMRALDNVGAYAGRAPFQLGKPIGAIVGPYKIESVQYRAHRRDDQQGHAGSGARLRPVADQLRDRTLDRRGRECCSASIASKCAGAISSA